MNKEIWKEYEYIRHEKQKKCLVSNLGNVKHLDGTPMKIGLNSAGYQIFDGLNFVHRVVASLFIPNTENKPIVDHIDTDKLNNNVDNLRWTTQSENCKNELTVKHRSEAMTGKPAWNAGLNKNTDDRIKKYCHKPEGFAAGEKNPMYGSTFTWVNDGDRNYRWPIGKELTEGLCSGMLRKCQTSN